MKKMMKYARNEVGLGVFNDVCRADGLPSTMETPPPSCLLPPLPGRTWFAAGVDDRGAIGPQRRPFCVPPPASPSTGSLARDYEDQLHLAASSTLLLERLQQASKEGLTTVLVTLALCVFIGLVVSAVLATSRRLVAGKDPDTEAAVAGLMLQARAVAPPVVTGSQRKPGADGGKACNSDGRTRSGPGRRRRTPPKRECAGALVRPAGGAGMDRGPELHCNSGAGYS
ncbi:hypothetical protein MTO96_015387 [Rhipicephalus appendiculatus]